MAEENLETVRRMQDAFTAGDFDAALEPYAEDAELDMTRMPGGGIYHGPEGVREFFTRWMGAWERFDVERLRLVEAGDAVVVVSRISAIGKGSGAEVTMLTADVFYVEDGAVSRHVGYPGADEALRELGLPDEPGAA
jgi:ketosteroid isomerase-like protein